MKEETKENIILAGIGILIIFIMVLGFKYDEKNPPKKRIYECETVQGEKIYCEYVHEPTRRIPLLYGDTKDGKRVQITSYKEVEVEE